MNFLDRLKLAETQHKSDQPRQPNQPKQQSSSGCCGGKKGYNVEMLNVNNKTYILRITEFCALSKHSKWHNWLGINAPDILNELLYHIGLVKNCSASTNKMFMIIGQLRERKLIESCVAFLLAEFPIVIVESDQ